MDAFELIDDDETYEAAIARCEAKLIEQAIRTCGKLTERRLDVSRSADLRRSLPDLEEVPMLPWCTLRLVLDAESSSGRHVTLYGTVQSSRAPRTQEQYVECAEAASTLGERGVTVALVDESGKERVSLSASGGDDEA